MFNPDDIVVRERQSGNRQAGNVSGGGYGRNGSGAYGQSIILKQLQGCMMKYRGK